jgi:adenylosuccinate synthase
MKVDVLLGLQWGDEGKGKVVDVLTPRYDVVARFQGGPNAGHTLEFEGQKYVLRSIPSGIFQGNKVNIIGNGVVLDPALFKAEAEALEKSGHPLKDVCTYLRKLISSCLHTACSTPPTRPPRATPRWAPPVRVSALHTPTRQAATE